MKKKKEKRPPQPVNLCMFCQQGGMSKEHIWPLWFGSVIHMDPNKGFESYHFSLTHDENLKPVVDSYPKQSKKHIGLRHIRRVCIKCNTGWMSTIQETSKPVLSKLMLNWPATINSTDQYTIAKWAVVASIVNDYAGEGGPIIPQLERDDYFATKEPSIKWKVWIAKIDGNTKALRNYDEHHTIVAITNLPNGEQLKVNYPTKFTLFRVGYFLVFTSYTELHNINLSFDGVFNNGMTEIYPSQAKDINWLDKQGINDNEIEFIIKFFSIKYPFFSINETGFKT